MRPAADELDDLDLPPLDGEEDTEVETALDPIDEGTDDGDAFDDVTGFAGENASLLPDEIPASGVEAGWLVDADDAATLDVGGLDVGGEPEEKLLEDDEPDTRPIAFDLIVAHESVMADGGEEGPLGDDEELREEDLPALDADEDGDVPDDDLFDQAALDGDDEELRWADRAWEPTNGGAVTNEHATDPEHEESGAIAVPDDRSQEARDATWRRLDAGGRSMAAAFVPGESVVVALASADRARALLVRIQPDGVARIIAEIDQRGSQAGGGGEDDGEACIVRHLRWDGGHGVLVASGTFGVQSFRPA